MLQKRIALLGQSRVDYPLNKTSQLIFEHSGDNLGNFLFRYALESLLENHHISTFNLSVDPQKLCAENDLIVIPSANQFNNRFDLTGWANFFEKCTIPLLAIGVGAQSAINQADAIQLKPGTRRYFDVLKEKCPTLLLRGAYTQECLAQIGITNTEILGCPSNLISDDEELGETVAAGFDRDITLLNIGSCELAGGQNGLTMEKKFIAECIQRQGIYSIQAPFSAFAGVWDRNFEAFDQYFGRFTNDARALYERSFVFASAEEWLRRLQGCSHSVGMRVHGTVAPLQAGVPAVCVVHDSRTKELAQTMKLPFLELGDAVDLAVPEILTQGAASFSARAYDANRKRQLEVVRQLFSSAGVELSQGGLPETFDWQKYIQHNPDLRSAGIDTFEKASTHWLLHGKSEARRY